MSKMQTKMEADPRIDPRIKALMGAMPMGNPGDAATREQVVAEANSAEGVASREARPAESYFRQF